MDHVVLNIVSMTDHFYSSEEESDMKLLMVAFNIVHLGEIRGV